VESHKRVPVRIELLGGLRISAGTRTVREDAWRLKKAAGLARGHRLHRERVLDMLWPELASRAAANNLRQTLYSARRTLGAVSDTPSRYLQLRNETLLLCPDEDLWVDVEIFGAEAALAHRDKDPSAYRRALDLYAGDLLPEDLYEEWTEGPRAELRQTCLSLLTGLARVHEQQGEYDNAIEALRRAVAAEPQLEEAHAGLMRVYALQGNRSEASRQYERLRNVLSSELGVEPGENSRRLHERILAGQRVDEVLEVGLDAAASAPPQDLALHNLPTSRTSLVGREDHRSEVGRLLSWTRLLTLTGAGGTGKTRLAAAVAEDRASAYPDGAWFVELAPLNDGSLGTREVARVFGVQERPGYPLSASLKEALGDRNALLVLDNCEHLVEASAELAEMLLDSCPQVRILGTSREPLNVEGEQIWRVPTLPAPPEGIPQEIPTLAGFEAVRLFEERARSRDPAFALDPSNAGAVAGICRQLDGIPLAIELAAAKVGALSVQQISDRLRDAPGLLTSGRRTAEPRQQTLRGALGWSYDLLEEPEWLLFERLSVFRGGWTLDAAEAVGGDGVSGERDVLEPLLGLVDKSLVAVEAGGEGDVRYRMLEPIRQYARERLEARSAQDVYERHARYFLGIAEQPESELRGERQVAWLKQMGTEYANVKVALAWALDPNSKPPAEGRVELGLRLAVALAQRGVWSAFGLGEGRMWLDRGLAAGSAIPLLSRRRP
jgi:predicted ATPase/DNA-binding SARP family transcriptional activator